MNRLKLPMTTNALNDLYWLKKVCFAYENNGFCGNHFLLWNVSMFVMITNAYDSMISCTVLKKSTSNLKPTVSAATIFWFWNRYWFGEVCFESETNGFCSDHFLVVENLNVVHGGQNIGSSVLIWRGLLRIWNQWFLQQRFSYGETSQCCPWQPAP